MSTTDVKSAKKLYAKMKKAQKAAEANQQKEGTPQESQVVENSREPEESKTTVEPEEHAEPQPKEETEQPEQPKQPEQPEQPKELTEEPKGPTEEPKEDPNEEPELNEAKTENTTSLNAQPELLNDTPTTDPKTTQSERVSDVLDNNKEEAKSTNEPSDSKIITELKIENEKLNTKIEELNATIKNLQLQIERVQCEAPVVSVSAEPNENAVHVRSSSFVDADEYNDVNVEVNNRPIETFKDYELDLRGWCVTRGIGPIVTV